MTNRSITLTPELYNYYAPRAFREPEILNELRVETAKLGGNAAMQVGPEQGAFMGMLAQMINAHHIIEFGTFTGYSSLAMALACSAHITCVDVSAEWTAIAQAYWKKAGLSRRFTLRLDGGAAAIADLLEKGRAGTFDLCFIDADKTGYDTYYEGALQVLRPGGVILIDNVLWGGDVANPEKDDADTNALRALNDKVHADGRVDIVMLPIGDGLTIARKK